MRKKFIYSAILIVIYAVYFVKTEKNIVILSECETVQQETIVALASQEMIWATVPQETIWAKSEDSNKETHELAYLKRLKIDKYFQYRITELKTGKEYEVCINEDTGITISVEDEVLIQSEFRGAATDIYTMVQVIDFNFDNHIDFILLTAEGTMNSDYYLYLFDPKNKEFVNLGIMFSREIYIQDGYINNFIYGGSVDDSETEYYTISEQNELLKINFN